MATELDKRSLKELTASINKNLNDFGYSGAFDNEIVAVLRGEEAATIIGMFARDMIEEAPADVIAAARRAATEDDEPAG